MEALLAGRTPDPAARERFARPRPRVREALWLQARGIPTAMVDLSDGLAGDAAHLAAASGVAMLLVPELIPVHPAARRALADRSLRRALGGGEDYELCFTAAVGAVEPHHAAFERAFGVRLSCVGRRGRGRRRVVRGRGGAPHGPPASTGWQHFGGGTP